MDTPNDWKFESWPLQPSGLRVGMPRGVKVTHLPTGEFETCDTERSQHANRDVALRKLAARLALQPNAAVKPRSEAESA